MKTNYLPAAKRTLKRLKSLNKSERQQYLEKVEHIIAEVKVKKPRHRTLKEHFCTVQRLRASYLRWRRELTK